MTTTHPSANDSGLNLDHLEALARAAGGITRDQIISREMLRSELTLPAVLELIALARRAAIANQPAPTVPADAMAQFAAWKGYELTALNSDGHFDKNWLHREWRAFQAGMARATHQPAQEQAEAVFVTRESALDAIRHVAESSVPGKTIRAARMLVSVTTAQQEPVAAPQQAAAPGALAADEMTRLRRLMRVIGWDHELDESDKIVRGTLFAVLGRAADKLEQAASSAPGTPEAPKPTFPISDDEMAALRRFWECATDGEGYDVEKAMMQRLAEMGLVQRKSGAYYMSTEFGLYVLGEYTMDRAAAPKGGA